NLDELESRGEKQSEGWFHLLRIIKSIGHKIITFVSQIEEFQKRLFEKKKFVLNVNYLVTLDRVPSTLHERILSNKDQIDEWRRLYRLETIEGNLEKPTTLATRDIDFQNRDR